MIYSLVALKNSEDAFGITLRKPFFLVEDEWVEIFCISSRAKRLEKVSNLEYWDSLLLDEFDNFKPSKSFDHQHNTEVSKDWKISFNLSDDELWMITRFVLKFPKYYNRIFKNVINDVVKKTFEISDRDFEKLSDRQKIDIVMGIASGFNYNDIYDFSVLELQGSSKDMTRQKDMEKKHNVCFQWILSEKTLNDIEMHFQRSEKLF